MNKKSAEQFELEASYFPVHEEPDSSEVTAAVSLKLSVPNAEAEGMAGTPSSERCMVLCLDKSGSMSGQYFESLKVSAVDVGEKAFGEGFVDSVYTIFYAGSAKVAEHRTLAELRKNIQKETAGGSTCFTAVYEQIVKLLSDRRKQGLLTRELNVLFFTDGLADNPKMAHARIPQMKEKIAQAEVQDSQFFSVGFSSGHDAKLLNSLTKAGTLTGGFFYIPTDAHDKNALIRQSMSDCWTLMGGKSAQLRAVVTVPSLKLERKLFLRPDGPDDAEAGTPGAHAAQPEPAAVVDDKPIVKVKLDEDEDDHPLEEAKAPPASKAADKERPKCSTFVGDLFLRLSREMEEADIEVKIEGTGVGVGVMRKTFPSSVEVVRKTLDFINVKVFEKLSAAQDKKSSDSGSGTGTLEQVASDLAGFDTRLDQVITDAFKMKGPLRKECLTEAQVIKGRVLEATAILRQCIVSKAAFSNDQVAKLNDLAYRGVNHRGLQKKLDQRALKNQPYFEKIEKELADIASQLDLAALRKNHGALVEKIGCCPLSVVDALEALAEGDCMCMCLSIARSEAAVADPSKLVIRDVTPTFMTASAFLDSAGFLLQKDAGAHGGFGREEGKLAEGVGRESVSGVLPLFLFPEHWSVARRNCPKVFGLMATADVMGFAQSQFYTIPFLVLARLADLLQSAPSEAREFQFDLALATCIAVVRPRQELTEEYVEDFRKFVAEPASRTQDQVASLRVLLARCLTLNRFGALQLSEADRSALFRLAAEEELRRMIKKDQAVPPRRQLLTMLDPEWAALVDAEVNKEFAQKGSASLSEDEKISRRMQILAGAEAEKEKEKEKEAAAAAEDAKGDEPGQPAKKAGASEAVVAARVAQQPWRRELLREKSDLYALTSGGLKTLSKRLGWMRGIQKMLGDETGAGELKGTPEERHVLTAVLLQNCLHPKNSQRRDAVERKEYREISSATEADQFFAWLLAKSFREEIQERKNELLASLASNQLEAASVKFAATQDTFLAAGVLQGKTWGGNLTPFYSKLQQQACPHAFAKIQMLVNGHFRGVTLIADKGKRNPDLKPVHWDPKAVNKKKFWRQNVYESKTMTQEEFTALFPDAAPLARKMWLVNCEKMHHRKA